MSNDAVRPAMGPLEWAGLAALSVLWGGSFLFVGIAVRELPPLTVATVRGGLAAAALHGALAAAGIRLPADGRVWAAFIGMGLLNNAVPFSLIAWGQSHVASGLASILIATAPLFSGVVAHLFTRDERMTGQRIAGVAVGLVGVAVMIGAAARRSLGVDVLAQLALLGAALSYAVAGVYGRRFKAMGVVPIATAAGQVTGSSLLLLPAMLAVDRPWTLPWPSPATILALIGLSLLATALAYVLYFSILAAAGATNVLLVTFLVPISAILLGAAVLGERLEARHLAGMALIGVGLALIDGRLAASALRRARRRSAAESSGR